MSQILRLAFLVGAMLLVGSTAHAQRVAAPARTGLAQHYLLSDNVGTWRHTSGGMGELTLTLGSNGTFRFTQVKSGETKRLAGEYAFVDGPGNRRSTQLLLFSGPRAANKAPAVQWTYSKSSANVLTLRDRMFFRVTTR